jgi:hypothetical protein
MKLFEFFGHQNLDFYRKHPDDSAQEKSKDHEEHLSNDVFYYILDHDNLHKKHFFDTAKTIKTKHQKDENHSPNYWNKMVEDGCVDFYHKNKMKGDIKEIFNKEFRDELCQRLADHYHKDIVKDDYKIGR